MFIKKDIKFKFRRENQNKSFSTQTTLRGMSEETRRVVSKLFRKDFSKSQASQNRINQSMDLDCLSIFNFIIKIPNNLKNKYSDY